MKGIPIHRCDNASQLVVDLRLGKIDVDKAESTGQAADVGVDGEHGTFQGEQQYTLRGLRSDAWERKKIALRVGVGERGKGIEGYPPVVAMKAIKNGEKARSFLIGKARGPNETRDGGQPHPPGAVPGTRSRLECIEGRAATLARGFLRKNGLNKDVDRIGGTLCRGSVQTPQSAGDPPGESAVGA